MLPLINEHRTAGATCGDTSYGPTKPLYMNAELRQAARLHSKDMADNNFFSHSGSDGSSPWKRISNAGYTGGATGENCAAGYSLAAAVVNGWMNSEGHCRNIMNPTPAGYRSEIGIGYAYNSGALYGHYWTQDFGSRMLTSTTSAPRGSPPPNVGRFYTGLLVNPDY